MRDNVPFLDLKAAHLELKEEIDEAISGVLASNSFVLSDEVTAFENEFAAYVETPHCIGVGNGLDALRLVLEAMGIGPGDEVIVSAHTFIATWLAVSACGAHPVAVEPLLGTRNIDPAEIEKAITSRTRAIVPVHLYGQPADLDPILDIASRHGLYVVEDAAQAHGAKYKGRRIGGAGDAVAWSFYPGKNLGAMGDGGAVTTTNKNLAELVRKLGNYGAERKYIHELKGCNSRLDALQAAVLRVKLKHLDEWNTRRKSVALKYQNALSIITGSGLPHVPDWADPVWHLFTICIDRRDDLQKFLKSKDVDTLIHYPVPPHMSQAYSNEQVWGKYPITEKLANKVLSLPLGPHIQDWQTEKVSELVVGFLSET